MSRDSDVQYLKDNNLPKFVESALNTVVPSKDPRPLERLNQAAFVSTKPPVVDEITGNSDNKKQQQQAASSSPPRKKPAADVTALATLDFDIFGYDFETDDSLLEMIETIFERHKILTTFKIPTETFRNWLRAVRANYHTEPQFHNFRHAFNVLQTLNVFLDGFKLGEWFTDMEKFAMLFSALCHDLQHPGVNNNFLINTEHDLALRYNNLAVLENHHCAVSFALLKATSSGICFSGTPSAAATKGSQKTLNCDILKGSIRSATGSFKDNAQYREFHALVCHCILSTEVAAHKKHIESLKSVIDAGFDKSNSDHRKCLMSSLVEAADISNEIRNFAFSRQWGPLVQEEFFRQGDQEKTLGIPHASGMFDREKSVLAKDQQGFIKFLCLPLYEQLCKIDDQFKICFDNLNTNHATWGAMIGDQ